MYGDSVPFVQVRGLTDGDNEMVQVINSDGATEVYIAKGADFIAFKIREIAQNNNIPIVENRVVARTLYSLVEIGDIIPSEMFQAVAEILAYVYNKNKS